MPQGIDRQVTEFIDHGKTIDLSGLAIMEKMEMGTYYLGFDRKVFIEEKVIKGY